MSKVYKLKFRSSVGCVRDYWKEQRPEAKVTALVNPNDMDEVFVLIENGCGFRAFEEYMFEKGFFVLPV